MKLIDGWYKKIHKLWTTRLALIGSAMGLASEALPQLQGMLPERWYIGLFVLILIARLVAQPKTNAD
jgi:hypothetical protein